MIKRHPGIDVTVAAAPLTLPLFEGVPNLKQLIPVVKKPLPYTSLTAVANAVAIASSVPR